MRTILVRWKRAVKQLTILLRALEVRVRIYRKKLVIQNSDFAPRVCTN